MLKLDSPHSALRFDLSSVFLKYELAMAQAFDDIEAEPLDVEVPRFRSTPYRKVLLG
jgi:hypothetical protein